MFANSELTDELGKHIISSNTSHSKLQPVGCGTYVSNAKNRNSKATAGILAAARSRKEPAAGRSENCGVVRRSRWQPEAHLGAERRKRGGAARPKANACIERSYAVTADPRDRVGDLRFLESSVAVKVGVPVLQLDGRDVNKSGTARALQPVVS
jgi:hypothetical protein